MLSMILLRQFSLHVTPLFHAITVRHDATMILPRCYAQMLIFSRALPPLCYTLIFADATPLLRRDDTLMPRRRL